MQALEIIGTIINSCWAILAFEVPGLGVSCQVFLAALLLISISIKAVQFVFGFGGSGSGYRSGQSGRKHISKNRKDDQY